MDIKASNYYSRGGTKDVGYYLSALEHVSIVILLDTADIWRNVNELIAKYE